MTNQKKEIYFPNLKFKNEKYVHLKTKFSPNKDETYYWMKYPHQLDYRRNAKITIYCSFDFSTFPFDSHECNVSYGINFLSNYFVLMMPTSVMHKKEERKLGEPSILGMYLSNEYFIG